MADKININPSAPELPPEAIAFATKMYDAARIGQMDIFQQALPAGLPANMTNEKGDSLVGSHLLSSPICMYVPSSLVTCRRCDLSRTS